MRFLFLTVAVLYLAILTVGALSGRIRPRSGCCAPADPAKDLRMRSAWRGPSARRETGGPTSRVDPPDRVR